MTLYWINEGADEHQGQLDDSGGPQAIDWSLPSSTARIRWRREGDVPPRPPFDSRSQLTPRERFRRSGRTFWHITPVANLPGIVEQGAILSDALQQGEKLSPLRVLGWGDIYVRAPAREYVAFSVTYRSAIRDIGALRPVGPPFAMLKVANDAVLRDGDDSVRFFPGWPEEMDLENDRRPGLPGARGAEWVFRSKDHVHAGSTAFVHEYVDLTEITEVHLLDPGPGTEERVRSLHWASGCDVKSVNSADWEKR